MKTIPQILAFITEKIYGRTSARSTDIAIALNDLAENVGVNEGDATLAIITAQNAQLSADTANSNANNASDNAWTALQNTQLIEAELNDVIHKTGDEDISGVKTFKSGSAPKYEGYSQDVIPYIGSGNQITRSDKFRYNNSSETLQTPKIKLNGAGFFGPLLVAEAKIAVTLTVPTSKGDGTFALTSDLTNLNQDDILDGTNFKQFSSAEKSKLANTTGIPTGGTTNQVLKKKSATNFDAEWKDESGNVDTDGSTVSYLQKLSGANKISNSIIREQGNSAIVSGTLETSRFKLEEYGQGAQINCGLAEALRFIVAGNVTYILNNGYPIQMTSFGMINFLGGSGETICGIGSGGGRKAVVINVQGVDKAEFKSTGLKVNDPVSFAQFTDGTEPVYSLGAQYFNTTKGTMQIGSGGVWKDTGVVGQSGTTFYVGSKSNFSTTNGNFFGADAGSGASGASGSNFFGYNSGSSATDANDSNFFGIYAGINAINARNSSFFGTFAGAGATNASNSNFFGNNAGNGASGASGSNFFGADAGVGATNATGSNFFGNSAGKSFTDNNVGYNNIIIGNYISLPNGYNNAMNIGGVLFGSGFNNYSSNPLIVPINGKIGINVVTPTEALDVNGNIKTNGLIKCGQFTDGTEPAYSKGAQYFNTTTNKMRIGGATNWETITSI